MWLPAITIAPPASEPVSDVQAKDYLRIDRDDTSFDDQLAGFISGARGQIEGITGTRLITQTVRLRCSAFDDFALLPIGPVQSIAEISYFDFDGAEQTIDTADYELVAAGLRATIQLSTGASWPAVRGGNGSISVVAIVGYGEANEVPPSVFIATLMTLRGIMDGAPVDVSGWLVNDRIWL